MTSCRDGKLELGVAGDGQITAQSAFQSRQCPLLTRSHAHQTIRNNSQLPSRQPLTHTIAKNTILIPPQTRRLVRRKQLALHLGLVGITLDTGVQSVPVVLFAESRAAGGCKVDVGAGVDEVCDGVAEGSAGG